MKMTNPLVATAESALSKSLHGKSRELWATSGSHFSVMLSTPSALLKVLLLLLLLLLYKEASAVLRALVLHVGSLLLAVVFL